MTSEQTAEKPTAESRHQLCAAEVGIGDGSDGKLKADTWYQLSGDGKFVECDK